MATRLVRKLGQYASAVFSAVALARLFDTISADVAIGTDEADSDEIDMQSMAGGSIEIDSDQTVTTLTYYAAHNPGDTYRPLYDEDNNAVTQTVAANRVQAMRKETYNCGMIKIVGNVAATVRVFRKG